MRVALRRTTAPRRARALRPRSLAHLAVPGFASRRLRRRHRGSCFSTRRCSEAHGGAAARSRGARHGSDIPARRAVGIVNEAVIRGGSREIARRSARAARQEAVPVMSSTANRRWSVPPLNLSAVLARYWSSSCFVTVDRRRRRAPFGAPRRRSSVTMNHHRSLLAPCIAPKCAPSRRLRTRRTDPTRPRGR